jgi:hypothetical protein
MGTTCEPMALQIGGAQQNACAAVPRAYPAERASRQASVGLRAGRER